MRTEATEGMGAIGRSLSIFSKTRHNFGPSPNSRDDAPSLPVPDRDPALKNENLQFTHMKTTLVTALMLALLAAPGFALTLPVTEDTSSAGTSIRPSAGKATSLAVGAGKKAFIKFDLSTLPGSVKSIFVTGARLRIYIASARNTSSSPLDVSLVTSEWHEDTATTVSEPTVAGFPFVSVGFSALKAKRFIYVDVLTHVQSWLNNPDSNQGFALTSTSSLTLGAKEGPGVGYPAELELDLDLASQVVTPDGLINGAGVVNGSIGSSQLSSSLTLAGTTIGTFSGNGAALTNLNMSSLVGQLTAAQIAAGSITTDKLADQSVTFSKRAPRPFTSPAGNCRLGAMATSGVKTGTDEQSLGLTTSLTTTGGAVFIIAFGEGFYVEDPTGITRARFYVVREDGVKTGTSFIRNQASPRSGVSHIWVPGGCISTIDDPPAGPHTYTVTGSGDQASTSFGCQNVQLFAFEL